MVALNQIKAEAPLNYFTLKVQLLFPFACLLGFINLLRLAFNINRMKFP